MKRVTELDYLARRPIQPSVFSLYLSPSSFTIAQSSTGLIGTVYSTDELHSYLRPRGRQGPVHIPGAIRHDTHHGPFTASRTQ
jgi:hypothetical protein